VQDNAAAYAEVRVDGSETHLDDVAGLVQELARTHGLVLVGGDLGPAEPLGRDGRSLADLASALRAPVVVVTGPDPDAEHTTLALADLSGRGLTATAVVAGGAVDPMLHASRRAPDAAKPEAAPAPAADAATVYDETMARFEEAVAGLTLTPPRGRPWRRRTGLGKRIIVGLVAFSVLLVAVIGGLALRGSPSSTPPGNVADGVRFNPVVPGGVIDLDQRRPEDIDGWSDEDLPSEPDPEQDSDTGLAVSDVCPQSAGTVAPGVPTAATTARVTAAWTRIETWLATHAPATRAALGAPASSAEVAAVQRRMSVAFPPDLVASLQRHDGSAERAGFTLPPFYRFLSTGEMMTEWTADCSLMALREDLGNDYWSPRYVPVARAPDSGALLLDQRPGGHGRVGEFYPEDGTAFAGWPATFTGLLEGTATSLETGAPYAGRYLPQVTDDGALRWRIL
jgi:cell wall assembly regulator SMI1